MGEPFDEPQPPRKRRRRRPEPPPPPHWTANVDWGQIAFFAMIAVMVVAICVAAAIEAALKKG